MRKPVLLFGLIGAAIILFFCIYNLRTEGRIYSNQAKAILSNASTYLKAYYSETKSYLDSNKVENIGLNKIFSFEKGFGAYSDGTKIPENIRTLLPSEFMPFIKEDSFRLLLVKQDKDKIVLWTKSSEDKFQELELDVNK